MRTSTWLAPVVLAVLAGSLVAIDRNLAASESAARDMRDRIGRLIRADERDRIPVAGVTVEIGDREKHTYVRAGDRWRILDPTNAVADADAIERLWKALLEGEGIVHSTDPSRLSEYGFSAATVIRVALHGPEVLKKKDRDVRYRCELGNRLQEIDGCYVRRDGSSHVWAIDSDPRAIIEQSRQGALPPLIESTLISRSWQRGGSQQDVTRVDAGDGSPPLELTLEQLPMEMDEMREGKDPFKFTAKRDGADVPIDSRTAMTWYSFVSSAKSAALLEPAAAAGIDVPNLRGAASIAFGFKSAGDPAAAPATPCSLLLSPPAADGSRFVYNTESKVMFRVGSDVGPLLIPTAEELATSGAENKWQQYLAKQQQESMPSIETPPAGK